MSVITLLLITLGNSYAKEKYDDDDDLRGVEAICKSTEKMLNHLSFQVDIGQKDYSRFNWFFYQDVTVWLNTREYYREIKLLEERWHNLGCVHYDIEQRKKSRR